MARKKHKKPAAGRPRARPRLDGLPQHVDVWQADFRLFADWVVEDGERIRPWVYLVVSQTSGLALGHAIERVPPSDEALWAVLAGAMQQPLSSQPHRPAVLQVRAEEPWGRLRPQLAELGIRLEIVPQLDVIDDALRSLFEHVAANREPGLLDSPDLTPARMRGFYEAAADYYRAAPWRAVDIDTIVEIESAAFWGGPWYAVIMGKSGMTFGLSLYEDLPLLLRTMSGLLSDDENVAQTVALTVTFDDATILPIADLDAIEQYGLPVAGPQAYPGPFKKERGKNMRTPKPWELQLLEASLRAVVESVRAGTKQRTKYTVPTAGGPVQLALTWRHGMTWE